MVAASQAARAGARTLLVEKSGLLGGTATLGGVNFPGLFHAWGRQIIAGIGWEWVEESSRRSGSPLPDFSDWRGKRHWQMQVRVNIPVYAAVADETVLSSGADLLFHAMPANARHEEGLWKIGLCRKEGLVEVAASVIVDATGDANLVALAGFPLRRNARLQPGTLAMCAEGYDLGAISEASMLAMEENFLDAVASGNMLRSDFQAAQNPVAAFLHGRGKNSIHIPGIDASTSEGKTRAEILARQSVLRIVSFFRKQPGMESFLIGSCAPECGIRETVTICGETRISREDYERGRVWPDSYCHSFYPIDVHNLAGEGGIDTRPLREGIVPTIPLGALLPRGSRNLVVAGRCACGDQEAHSAFRVQASAMAMGQVAGAVAAMAATTGSELREVEGAALRHLLRANGAVVPGA